MFNLLKLNVFCFLNYLVAGRVEQFLPQINEVMNLSIANFVNLQ